MNVARTGMRVVVATRPVKFRKGHDGLAAVVDEALGLDASATKPVNVPCSSWDNASTSTNRTGRHDADASTTDARTPAETGRDAGAHRAYCTAPGIPEAGM